jgi:hypothetical protein
MIILSDYNNLIFKDKRKIALCNILNLGTFLPDRAVAELKILLQQDYLHLRI